MIMGGILTRRLTEDDGVDPLDLKDFLAEGARWAAERVPARYATAEITDQATATWVDQVVGAAVADMMMGYPAVISGPSAVLAGKAGRGKTHTAWAAARALSGSGAVCKWVFVRAAELFSSLQPRHGVDHEEMFESYATAPVLVIDDLGATKDSAWRDETLDRILDTRYAGPTGYRQKLSYQSRPTLITTNVMPQEFGARFGERVMSRLAEMATVVPFTGPDLRRQGGV